MARKIPVLIGALLITLAAVADEVTLRADHPQTYTVVKGDTLWDISGRFLERPWQWPDLWEANPQIENPHLIYPGDTLALRYVDGRPVLGLAGRSREVKLSPTIRESRHADSIHAIPLDAVQPFLARPRVVAEGELDSAAYVVGGKEEHLAYGTGHVIYVNGLRDETTNKFSAYRQGKPYVDPDTGEFLGYEADHVGDLVAERFGSPATMRIARAYKEILDGDRVIPEETLEIPEFLPHAPNTELNGRIISVHDGVEQVSRYQVVVLNRGAADGLEAGHVLAIYQDGEIVKDKLGSDLADIEREAERARQAQENPSAMGRMLQTIVNDVRAADRALRDVVGTPKRGGSAVTLKLPAERAGEVMVFRAFDRISYALVMNMQRPVYVNDLIRNP